MNAPTRAMKRILWVDDEIDLLKPHLLFLQARGYHVDAIANGDDALELIREAPYDLVLLDEQMPGRRGLEVLQILRRKDPHQKVVMVTKSEEDLTMTEAIGRRVDDYLVKPTSPRQVLSVVTRILEGSSIRQQRAAQDFAARFGALAQEAQSAGTPDDFAGVYMELVDWQLRLGEAGEAGLLDTVQALLIDLRRAFGEWVVREYRHWVADSEDRPRLSVDLVREFLVPRLGTDPVYFVVLDCMRLDQWRAIAPLLAEFFEVDETYHYSILPTATPYARNAIFSGQYPDQIAAERPGWWDSSDDEGSLNAFEDELLVEQLKRLTGRDVPVHYEKIFSDRQGEQVRGRVNSALKTEGTVVALVFNFVDLMTHGRSESPILMEVARDEAALRDLTRGAPRGVASRIEGDSDHGPRLDPLSSPFHRLCEEGRHEQSPLQVRPGPPRRGQLDGLPDTGRGGPPSSGGTPGHVVSRGARRLLLRVPDQVAGVSGALPELVSARRDQPRRDDRPRGDFDASALTAPLHQDPGHVRGPAGSGYLFS